LRTETPVEGTFDNTVYLDFACYCAFYEKGVLFAVDKEVIILKVDDFDESAQMRFVYFLNDLYYQYHWLLDSIDIPEVKELLYRSTPSVPEWDEKIAAKFKVANQPMHCPDALFRLKKHYLRRRGVTEIHY